MGFPTSWSHARVVRSVQSWQEDASSACGDAIDDEASESAEQERAETRALEDDQVERTSRRGAATFSRPS